ncbi:MAG TPA: GNAT family N-acetyltransferase [Burkholderiales bacterium]|nr:GNAT family N-acetyltransferase [Burkholderiales bacterium]
MPRIELLPWEKARAHASPIRFSVFVEEQGVPREIELDEHDPVCVHAVVFEDGRAVATGRLLPDGHIGRMAVLKAWRGRGIGAALLNELLKAASKRGHREVALSAQVQALPFYRAQGFIPVGEEYLEAGIPHQAMKRPL